MPTILLMVKYPLHLQDNLKGKLLGEANGFRALGYRTLLMGWNERGIHLLDGETQRLVLPVHGARLPGYSHLKLFWDMATAAKRVLRSEQIDLVYMRFTPLCRQALSMISLCKRLGVRFTMEIPTYPPAKEPDYRFAVRALLRLSERRLRRISPKIDLFTLIGEHTDGLLYGRPAINISNGADLTDLPVRVPRLDADVHLLLLASVTRYQGYDRLLDGMAQYRGDRRVVLHLVGGDVDGSGQRLRRQADELGYKDLVVHGPLYGDALTEIVARCDAGVGTLGLYRKGLQEGSVLKVREYLGRGLPVVYAGDDPLLTESASFLLHVSNDDAPIDIQAIVDFVTPLKTQAELPLTIRAYAERHLSWETQLAPVLERVDL